MSVLFPKNKIFKIVFLDNINNFKNVIIAYESLKIYRIADLICYLANGICHKAEFSTY